MARPKGAPDCPINIAARNAALSEGRASYSTGIPCRYGHVSVRNAKSNTCMQCDRDRYKVRAAQRIVQMAVWREANPEKQHNASNNWKRRNPDSSFDHHQRRRARCANGEGFTKDQVRNVLNKQMGKCINCLKIVGDNYHADHIMPISKGGLHAISNIQVLCPMCNHRKHKKDPVEWAQQQGRLL